MYNIVCNVIVIYSTKGVMKAMKTETMVMIPMKRLIGVFNLYFFYIYFMYKLITSYLFLWFMKYLKLKLKLISV